MDWATSCNLDYFCFMFVLSFANRQKHVLLLFLFQLLVGIGIAQPPTKVKTQLNLDESQPVQNNINNNGNINNNQNNSNIPRKDSLGFEHRDNAKDSINIYYRFADSTRKITLDSSVNDFDSYFSIPSSFAYLGNNGAAAVSLLYRPNLITGFDPGFHAYDIYRLTPDKIKYYKTNKPFTMLAYQLASGKEQLLRATHTQNPRPNLNFGFDFNLITAPGFFVTQNTNHSNVDIFAAYEGNRKRYRAQFAFLHNSIRASENGGIQNDSDLKDPNRKDRFSVPVNLGNNAAFRTNPFITSILTGNSYTDQTFLIRQSYDFGKKDSVAINDSTTEYLFYPKFRWQHTFTYSTHQYGFQDVFADSATYSNWYGLPLTGNNDTLSIQQRWTKLNNDLSLIQFPDTRNTAQYLSAGITTQQIAGELQSGNLRFYNILAHGAYCNRTRNKLWDINLSGEFYLNGNNAGDYLIQASLSRWVNKKWGLFKVHLENVNRTPSFVFDSRSDFYFGNARKFDKENCISFGASTVNKLFTLSVTNSLVANQVYFHNLKDADQYAPLFNVLQVQFSKKIQLSKYWKWYVDASFQQTDGAAPVRVPLIFTRNRIAYEGVFFKNLHLSTGLEVRYYSPYKAYGYSPLNGQWVSQDAAIVRNIPDMSAYMHFRIRGFKGFLRAENLNTMSFSDGFGFTNNNFAAPSYPTQGFIFRFGVQWWYVN